MTTRARRSAATIALAALLAGVACASADSPAERDASGSSTNRWRALRAAELLRTEVGAARIGRFIYVVGGYLASGETTAAVERYDIVRNRWERIAPMPVAVNHPAVTAHRGMLYVFGGFTGASAEPVTAALQRFDPRSGVWTQLAPALTPRGAAALVALGGRLYAIGGAAEAALRVVEVFDPSRNRWRSAPRLDIAREHIAATVAEGDVYVFGGRAGGENLRSVERLDPGHGGWRRVPPMRRARSGFAAVSVRGHPVVFGGEELVPGGTTIRPVELFDPESDRWRRLPGMRTPRHGLGGALKGRRVYSLQGGPQPGLTVSGAIEFLDVPRRALR